MRIEMTVIRYMTLDDKNFWYSLDKHLPEEEFANKVRDRRGYVLEADGKQVGLLRYNFFWDNTPFCTLLFVDWPDQKKSYGRILMEHWEADMMEKGLVGPNSEEKRRQLLQRLRLPGHMTANALLEALNLLMTREEFDAL